MPVHCGSALAHTWKSVAIAAIGGIESFAVVTDDQLQAILFDSEFDVCHLTTRVARAVVNALFKYQEDFATDVGAQSEIVIGIRRVELERDVTRVKRFSGKSSHPMNQIAEMVFVRVNRPDDVTHRIEELMRGGRNPR